MHKDLTGKKFGRLTALAFVEMRRFDSGTVSIWRCRCDCGRTIEVLATNLRAAKSCGCTKTERWIKYRLKVRPAHA